MSYVTIPAKQDGSSWNPYLVSAAPSTSPGYAAAIYSNAYDSTNNVWYVKYGALDTDWKPSTGAQAYPNDESYYKARARALMGSPRLTCWWWNDFLEPLSESFITGASSATCTFTTKYNDCGVATLTCPENATGSNAIILATGTVVAPPGNQIPVDSGGWYIASRFKSAGALENATQRAPCFMWLDSGTASGYFLAGIYNKTTYKFQSNLGSYDSTTAIDGNTHLHEVARTGTTTTYYLDEVPIMSGNYIGTGNMAFGFQAQNNSCTTGATVMHMDYACYAVGGNNARTIT
jgi:hypothetical protein